MIWPNFNEIGDSNTSWTEETWNLCNFWKFAAHIKFWKVYKFRTAVKFAWNTSLFVRTINFPKLNFAISFLKFSGKNDAVNPINLTISLRTRIRKVKTKHRTSKMKHYVRHSISSITYAAENSIWKKFVVSINTTPVDTYWPMTCSRNAQFRWEISTKCFVRNG